MRRGPYHSHADAHSRRRAAVRGQPAVTPLHEFVSLIPFVVKRGECQHVEEKQRSSNSYRHTQLGRVVPCFTGKRRVAGSFRNIRISIRWVSGDYRVSCGAGARMRGLPSVIGRQPSGNGANDFLM